MRRHFAYLNYIIRHKYFVFIACWKLDVSLWRALIHDWHKFLPCEWFPYASTFYHHDGTNAKYETNQAFEMAWNHHEKLGKHHWQYWLLTFDNGTTKALDMPTPYLREMLADWWGAGRAITGNWDANTWYEKNKDKMNLSPVTRGLVELWLPESANHFETPALLAKRRRILGY